MECQSDAEEIVEPEEQNFQNRELEEESVSNEQQNNDQSLVDNTSTSTVSTKSPHHTTNNPEEVQESKVQQQDETIKTSYRTYKKRREAIDHGKGYEYLICTYYALKLLDDKNVIDFEMTTNDKRYGAFDDVALTVTFSDQTKHTFLMQLKHADSPEKGVITDTLLAKEKGDFSLQKYLISFIFDKLKTQDNISCILFTNKTSKIEPKSEIQAHFAIPTAKQCPSNAKCGLLNTDENKTSKIKPKSEIQAHFAILTAKQCPSNDKCGLLKTDENKYNSCFQFELKQKEEYPADVAEFFQCFYLLTNQINYKKAISLIDGMLLKMFGCKIEFTSFMQHWWCENFVLTKHDVIVKLAELALSPFIQEIPRNSDRSADKSVLDKSKILRNAITKFEMTLVKDYCADTIGQIWTEISNDDDAANISIASRKYGLSTTGTANTNQVISIDQTKILWYLNKVPLIVKYEDKKDEQIQGAIRLLEKDVNKKKIVMLTNKAKEEFPEWKIFENLHDLQKEDIEEDIKSYNDIIENFKISLQGRPSIYLKQLFDSNFANVIEVGHLFLMLEEDFCVGEKASKLPEAYIPRSISTLLLDTEAFLEYYKSLDDGLLIINDSCNNDLRNVTNVANAQTIYFEDFLTQIHSEINKKKHLIVLATDNKCTKFSFKKICERYKKRPIYLIQIIAKNCSMLVKAEGNISSLKTVQYKDDSLKEDQLYSVFQNPVNIVIGQPGIGKSTLLRYLSQTCPNDCWCVLVNLIQHSSFLSEEPSSDEILDEFLKSECAFFGKTKNQFQQSGRLYLLLDGLDEIHSDSFRTVLDFIEDLSCTGIKFWISSRENLKETIVQKFNTFPIDIEELTQEEQRKYLHDRLINTYTEKEIDNIICKIFASINISHNVKNILGVPLQLHIITEILLNDRKTYEKLNEDIFVLSKMYKIFFQGKHKHLLKTKVEAKHTDPLENDLDHTLEQYEIAALKTCLDNDTFNKLELVNSREMNKCGKFLKVLQDEGDKLGIISKVIGENEALQAIFSHQSFAEYFACVWLKNNVDKLRLIKDEFFDIKYQNLRLIFDIMLAEKKPLHLGVLYKNPDEVKKNLERYNEKDEGGRNALHLICSYGTKYNSTDNYYHWDSNRETMTYIKIFEMLLNCNFVEIDSLFKWNCMDYALKRQCLFPFEMNCTRIDDLTEHFNKSELALFCAYCGYTNTLKTLIKKDKNVLEYQNVFRPKRILLHEAVRGSAETDETGLKDMNIKTIKMLVEYGCDINIRDYKKNTPLHLACDINDFYAAEALLKNGACVNALNGQNRNALHIALVHNKDINVNLIKLLIDYKVEVNVESNSTDIPLLQAASCPNKDILKLIILSGANVNVADKYGCTPLQQACEAGIYENVIILINAGADISSVTLHNACYNPNIDVISFLLGKKLDINARGSNGNTPLHLVCRYGTFDIFQYFVENGANINFVNNVKETMLHCACEFSKRTDPKIIRYLLNNGINLEDIDSQGYTALQEACRWGNYIAVKELIECGANVKVTTESKETLLHLVSKKYESNNTADIIRLLTEKGVNTNDMNEENYTALHVSSQFNNYEVARALIDCGSNVNALTKSKENALHILVQSSEMYGKNKIKIIKLLIASGVDVNQENDNGYTSIQIALKINLNFSCIKALLDSNDDINIKTNLNETLLHLALKYYREVIRIPKNDTSIINVINLLIKKGIYINEKDAGGYNALHLTCKYNRYYLTEVLLNNRININEVTKDQETALHIVVKTDKPNIDLIKLLIERGVDKNALDKDGYSALHHACTKKNDSFSSFYNEEEVVKALVECNCDVNVLTNQNESPLHLSVKRTIPNMETLRILLENGAKVNGTNKDEYTALHLACKYVRIINAELVTKCTPRENHIGYIQKISEEIYSPLSNVIKLLIQKGGDINAVDKFGYTPLHITFAEVSHNISVTKYGDPIFHIAGAGTTVAKLLVQKGADITALTKDHKTMLHTALRNNIPDIEMLSYLTNSGLIDINAKDKNGYTALHLACLYVNQCKISIADWHNDNKKYTTNTFIPVIEAINLLIRKGADIDATDTEGYTPLHLAYIRVKHSAINTLLQHNANLRALSSARESMLHLAAEQELTDPEIIEMLIENGMNIDATDKYGYTPLHKACLSGNLNTIIILYQKKADVTALTSNGDTVLHLAAKRWSQDLRIIHFLLQCKININAVNKEGYTALHYACNEQILEIFPLFNEAFFISYYNEVKFLIDSGAKVDSLTNNNETTLLLALNKPQPELGVVQLLLSKCEELVNMTDKNGMSPLFLAYKSRNRPILDFLLSKNILLDHKTRDLLIADFPNVLLMGNVKLMQLLLKNISSVGEIKIDDNEMIPNFPLHLAKRNGCLQADLLLEMVRYIDEFYTTNHPPYLKKDLISYIIQMFEKSSSSTTNDQHPSTSRTTPQ